MKALKADKIYAFRKSLGFNVSDAFNAEQSVLEAIKEVFKGEHTQTQYIVLSFRTDLRFHQCKLAVEVDEYGDMDRDEHKEIERQEAIKEKLQCVFIRINPD